MFFSPKIHVQKEKNIFVKQAATSTVQGKLGLVRCLKKKKKGSYLSDTDIGKKLLSSKAWGSAT